MKEFGPELPQNQGKGTTKTKQELWYKTSKNVQALKQAVDIPPAGQPIPEKVERERPTQKIESSKPIFFNYEIWKGNSYNDECKNAL